MQNSWEGRLQNFGWKVGGKDHLEDLGICERTLLKIDNEIGWGGLDSSG